MRSLIPAWPPRALASTTMASMPRRAAADDDQVVGRPAGLDAEADPGSKGLVARVHLVGSVPEDDGRDDLSTVLNLLEAFDRLRVLVDIDAVVPDTVGGEKLLDPLAMGAPRGPVHGQGPVVGGGHRVTLPTAAEIKNASRSLAAPTRRRPGPTASRRQDPGQVLAGRSPGGRLCGLSGDGSLAEFLAELLFERQDLGCHGLGPQGLEVRVAGVALGVPLVGELS